MKCDIDIYNLTQYVLTLIEIYFSFKFSLKFVKTKTGWILRFTNPLPSELENPEFRRPDRYVFPPKGTTCTGSAGNEVVIRFPPTAGLLINDYTLELNVQNPTVLPNSTVVPTSDDLWTILTRINNEQKGMVIVDAKRDFESNIVLQPLPPPPYLDPEPSHSTSPRTLFISAAAILSCVYIYF